MRIISGQLKGRRITAPTRLPVRPTTDMAKEGLFNILNNHYYFDEIKVLDLFSGTGNISYEFASRGVPTITAIDANAECIRFIEKTASTLDMNISAHRADVFKYLEKNTVPYDVVFADPPYNLDVTDFEKIHESVYKNNMLLPEGRLIIEHAKQMKLSHLSHFLSERKYGGSVFSFFGVDISAVSGS